MSLFANTQKPKIALFLDGKPIKESANPDIFLMRITEKPVKIKKGFDNGRPLSALLKISKELKDIFEASDEYREVLAGKDIFIADFYGDGLQAKIFTFEQYEPFHENDRHKIYPDTLSSGEIHPLKGEKILRNGKPFYRASDVEIDTPLEIAKLKDELLPILQTDTYKHRVAAKLEAEKAEAYS